MKRLLNVIYNLAQLIFNAAVQKFIVLEWGRGTGKSTIIAKRIIDCVFQMPRSTGGLCGATFMQIKTRTLPSTIKGLEQHGYYKDVHFVVGVAPPKSWPKAYQPPLDYKNTMCWFNGTVVVFISQDFSASSGRGLNLDWVAADEAALLDEKRFQEDVLLSNRGNMKQMAIYKNERPREFGKCPLHHSVLLASTSPATLSGQWILKYQELSRKNPKEFGFYRANALMNLENLGQDYFNKAREIMPDFMYDLEIMNKRMSITKNGFYPLFNIKKHCYNAYNNEYYQEFELSESPNCNGDSDLDREKELIVSMDFGASINCIVVGQANEQVHRIINSFYVLSPKIIEHLCQDFCEYYQEHPKKVIYFWYDPSGNNRVPNSNLTYAQSAEEVFKRFGWEVVTMTLPHSYNESHNLKFNLWNKILGENKTEMFPVFRMNEGNNLELIVSVSNAKAKQGTKQAVQKDKSSERKKNLNQAHATHFSDALDFQIVGMYMHRNFSQSNQLDAGIR